MRLEIPEEIRHNIEDISLVYLEYCFDENFQTKINSMQVYNAHIKVCNFIDLAENTYNQICNLRFKAIHKNSTETFFNFDKKEDATYTHKVVSGLTLPNFASSAPAFVPEYDKELLPQQYTPCTEINADLNILQFKHLKNIPCYIINLEKDVNRFKASSSCLKKLGFKNIKRWSASCIKEESIEDQLKSLGCFSTIHAFRNKQEMACTTSHLTLLQHFLDSKDNYCIIFEDDILFHENFKHLFDQLNTSLDDWDVLFLGGWLWSYAKAADFIKAETLDKISFSLKSVEAHAYVINKRFAWEAINSFKLAEVKNTIDMHYAYYMPNNFKKGLLTHSPYTSKLVQKIKNPDSKRCGLVYQSNQYDSNIQSVSKTNKTLMQKFIDLF